MKRAYYIIVVALSAIVLSWFLPWLYSIVFPSAAADQFVAWSPVSDSFIVSDNSQEGVTDIFAIDAEGRRTATFTKEERDSLLPQIYYTQLMARDHMPDSLAGREVSVATLKHNQWVFTSLPRDINRTLPTVLMMMESMPERYDLEDPDEVFTLDGSVEFTDMRTNSVNAGRSRRFTDIFADRGFTYPVKAWSANITTRKPYDNGYLLVDDQGQLYHLKMQAGRPYMMNVALPADTKAAHVWVLENPETHYLGIVSTDDGRLFALEREGYLLAELPVGTVDPESEKISIVKNLFNWVVRVSGTEGSRFYAFESDSYRPLGEYGYEYPVTMAERVSRYLFPFVVTFTSTSDQWAHPRIINGSLSALYLNVVLALTVAAVAVRRRRLSPSAIALRSILTAVFGLYLFIPLMLIEE